MEKSLTEMAAEIAAAQASHALMPAEEIGTFLKRVFQALRQMRRIEEADVEGDGRGRDLDARKKF